MQEENALPNSKKERSQLKQMIYWWEGNRIWFNLIILVPTSLLYGSMFSLDNDYISEQFIKYFISVNVFYTFAWVYGWIYHLFFDAPYESSKTRRLVFFMGVFFGLIIVNLPVLIGP